MLYNNLVCKLCGSVLSEANRSKADPTLCKSCYSDVMFYRRYPTNKQNNMKAVVRYLDVRDKLVVAQITSGYELVMENVVRCRACGKAAKGICEGCRSRSEAYQRLVEKGKMTDKLFEYENFYSIAKQRGLQVPSLFMKRWRQ